MNPAAAVRHCPAFWCPNIAASVVIADTCSDLHTALPGPAPRLLIAEQNDAAGRYVILQGRRARHRLRLFRSGKSRTPFEFRIPADAHIGARLAALAAFSLGAGSQAHRRLTSYRRHRLVCLLAVLDLVETAEPDAAVLRRIAALLFSGRVALARAIEWKASSERRQAQRLLAEARRMTAKGYLDLLAGSAA